MELEDRTVVMYLNSRGIQDLTPVVGAIDEPGGLDGLVRATDGFGIWLSLFGTQSRVLIVPWQYVRALEFELEGETPAEVRKPIGFET